MWTIQPQTEKCFKNERAVFCKHIKCFPIEGGRTIEFGKLAFLNLRVIISHERHGTLSLSLSAKDFENPNFAVTHPDTAGKPKIWVGEGKKRRQIEDVLSKDVAIKGLKEKYEGPAEFEARLKQLGGEELADKVMTAFAARFAEFAAKPRKAA